MATDERPTLAIVVVNYRTPHDLADFLISYLEHRPRVSHRLTIVNVDPLPADTEVVTAFLEDDRYINTDHLVFSENVGYAVACNQAAAESDSEFIVFFNADIVLSANAIDECVEALASHPDRAIVGPRQVDHAGRITAGGIFGTLASPAHRGWHETTDQYKDVRDDAMSVSGAAYFIRRSVWDMLTECPTYQGVAAGARGAFLPTRLFFEESACSYHARAHGFGICYLGSNW